jgi:hypothetical protein
LGYGTLLPARATGTQTRAITALYSFIAFSPLFRIQVRSLDAERKDTWAIKFNSDLFGLAVIRSRHSTHVAYQDRDVGQFIPSFRWQLSAVSLLIDGHDEE